LIKKSLRNEPIQTSGQTGNSTNLLKMYNSYSNYLAQPFEVVLSVKMSSNLRGETIPRACSCFFEKLWNNHKVNSVYSIQKCRSKYSFGEGKVRQRGKPNWLEKNIMRKLFREGENEIFIEGKKVSINCL
jgi:hypothetical protein